MYKQLRLILIYFTNHHLECSTDYRHTQRKQSSLHSQKFNSNPKFLGTAEAYFVCHIGPKFQLLFFIYAFIECPQSVGDRIDLNFDQFQNTFWQNCRVQKLDDMYWAEKHSVKAKGIKGIEQSGCTSKVRISDCYSYLCQCCESQFSYCMQFDSWHAN